MWIVKPGQSVGLLNCSQHTKYEYANCLGLCFGLEQYLSVKFSCLLIGEGEPLKVRSLTCEHHMSTSSHFFWTGNSPQQMLVCCCTYQVKGWEGLGSKQSQSLLLCLLMLLPFTINGFLKCPSYIILIVQQKKSVLIHNSLIYVI